MLVKILGRTIGSCETHGDRNTDTTVYYGFEPADGVNLPAMPDLTVDFETGEFQHWQTSTLVATYRLVSLDPPIFTRVRDGAPEVHDADLPGS